LQSLSGNNDYYYYYSTSKPTTMALAADEGWTKSQLMGGVEESAIATKKGKVRMFMLFRDGCIGLVVCQLLLQLRQSRESDHSDHSILGLHR
jgi:hypothetical protein